ncbi:DsbA family oxidoreductase [Piscinibacter gummiphilus]|uniref:Uncharacterized protein n=1 Tax=Piscinibacter gummiphilus TaxID=946333 RepID=A0A1W6LEW1_9BURK|nr:DsbA family oxidoreductase [Piscinibacter gummiphilus]ARN22812.1 hypothetical protein A4W93_24485 [Piscinibacter gummiphilus]ATU67510.1 DsbA family oxidoreductase [Piscinibacter gummiphilus]GLS96624.1 DSBA oxidoreductase [Piscinibacter gummiphilus]
MKGALDVEVWFDFICPWCLIGKRQLEEALARYRALHPQRPVRVHWRSQQLLPDVPAQGVPFREFYLARLGSAEAVAARQAQVRRAGATVGLDFDFDRIPLMPNTRAAHALLADAAEQCDPAVVDDLVDRLFELHFMRRANLDDDALLEALAQHHGIERTRAEPEPEPTVSGVPLFLVNRTVALGGAQPAEQLLALLIDADRAAA